MKKYTPVITVVAIALAGFLLYRALDRYSFDQVVASVIAIPRTRLLAAGGFAAASYVCLTGFDALGVRYAGRPIAYGRVALASFTALSIGHNLGFAALSSGAVRYRFYRRWGLIAEEVARVIVFCGATVGLGLLILAGSALLLHPGLAECASGLPRATVLGLGVVCLALAGAYVVLAALVRRQSGTRVPIRECPSHQSHLATTLSFADMIFRARCVGLVSVHRHASRGTSRFDRGEEVNHGDISGDED